MPNLSPGQSITFLTLPHNHIRGVVEAVNPCVLIETRTGESFCRFCGHSANAGHYVIRFENANHEACLSVTNTRIAPLPRA